ncbi:MAG: hypothetical protein WD226_10275 [Planctomycetota bacterium]
MSSKSRKHSPAKGQRPTPAELLAPGEPGHDVPDASAFEVPDELIRAPKETSKLRFVLMVLLVIVLLIIFVAPSAFMGVTSGGGQDMSGTYATWTMPAGDEVGMDQASFMNAKREFDSSFAVHPLLRMRLGVEDRSPSDVETARFLILDRLAVESGIQVTDAELATELRDSFDLYSSLPQFGGPGTLAEYRALANRYGGPAKIEATLRRVLRIERMLGIVGGLAALPDPVRIEELWNAAHAEQAFDYVAVSQETLEEAARAELPDDDALDAWFRELPEDEQRAFLLPETRAITLASFVDFEATPATGLLAAYPEPEDADAEERAETYYNRVFFLRFRRPEPAADAEETAVDEPAASTTPYLSFDEVRERALLEAPVFFALQSWNEALKTQALAGEDIDLAAEAERLGLAVRSIGPITRNDLIELETFGGIATAASAFQAKEGNFLANVNVLEDVMSVGRVDAVTKAQEPPFEEIRDEVGDLWVAERAAELVDERLASMRTTFEAFTPEVAEDEANGAAAPRTGDLRRASEEEFRAAAEALGLEVQRTAYLDKGARTLSAWSDSDSDLARFLWRNRQFRELEVGEVAEPVADAALGQTILMRLADERPLAIDEMTPADYQAYATQSANAVRQELMQGFDEDYLREHFQLEIQRPEDTDETGEDL